MKQNVVPVVCLGLAAFFLLFAQFETCVSGQTQQDSWRSYAPARASFELQIPADPAKAQGHIFDPSEVEDSVGYIQGSRNPRIHNFEINLDGKRMFLVSILEVEMRKIPPRPVLTKALMTGIGWTISDETRPEDWSATSESDGETARWNYKTQGNDAGAVKALRVGKRIVIVVVDFDHVERGSPIIERMLASLRINK